MVVNLERLSETERKKYLENAEKIKWFETASPEDLDKLNLVGYLEGFIGFAEELLSKNFFLRLFYACRLAKVELSVASVYVETAKSKGYASTPEIKEWIDKYNSLLKKVR